MALEPKDTSCFSNSQEVLKAFFMALEGGNVPRIFIFRSSSQT